MDCREMVKLLETRHRIIYRPIMDSTNIRAKEEGKRGDVFLAGMQTMGRGRRGRSWISNPKDGLYLSLIPFTFPDSPAQVTILAALAVSQAISICTKLSPQIKWPNDVLINGKKICGILAEMESRGSQIQNIVVGMGINVFHRQMPDFLLNSATSLYLQGVTEISLEKLAAEVVNAYDAYANLHFSDALTAYRKQCCTIHQTVDAIYCDHVITGKAIDIDEDGALLLATKTGTVALQSGEVSIRNGGTFSGK